MSFKERPGSVVSEAARLVPLVGRVLRRRVGEWVEETRQGVRAAIRDVRQELERELTDSPAEEDGGAQPTGGVRVHTEDRPHVDESAD